jgi:flagellar L-ring protein precursor FlgH
MPLSRRLLFVLSFTAASSAIVAAAQVSTNTSRPNGGPATAQPSQPAVAENQLSSGQPRTISTSLLRAAVSAQVPAQLSNSNEPAPGTLAQISFLAVPDPKPKIIKKHDLITLIIREESEFSSEGTTDLKKNADLNAAIQQFVRLSLDNKALKSNVGANGPAVQMTGQRDFKGEATVDRTDSYTQRVGAEVIDVKPNGTLVIQAMKTIQTDEEEQTVILSGVCRSEDITADNTVLSTQLHDLVVRKTHKGAVRDTTKRGWVPRLLDVLNPF